MSRPDEAAGAAGLYFFWQRSYAPVRSPGDCRHGERVSGLFGISPVPGPVTTHAFREAFMKAEHFGNGVEVLLEAVLFEQWIRFCWIVEEADGCLVRIPEAELAAVGESYPRFRPLLQSLNNRPVDAERSCAAVLDYGRNCLGSELDRVLASPLFQEQVARLHLWLARKGEELEDSRPSFAAWKALVAQDATGEQAES